MKRIGNIYSKIAERENCKQAIIKASKGKKSRKDVRKVVENIEYYTDTLLDILINKKYKPNPYKEKKIFDGANQKERIIYKPQFFPDQCIHWSLMRQLKPILRKGMYEYCCASIEGRGILYRCKICKKNSCKR